MVKVLFIFESFVDFFDIFWFFQFERYGECKHQTFTCFTEIWCRKDIWRLSVVATASPWIEQGGLWPCIAWGTCFIVQSIVFITNNIVVFAYCVNAKLRWMSQIRFMQTSWKVMLLTTYGRYALTLLFSLFFSFCHISYI